MWKFVQRSLALVALLAAASPALADTTFSNASARVQPKPFDLHDHFKFDITVYYNGASITGLGSPYQPTADGYDDTSNKTMFQTRFRPQYKITPAIAIGPVLEWNYFPNFGGDYRFGDIFLRVAHSKIIDQPQLQTSGNFQLYFPNSGGSIDADMIVSARIYTDSTYTFKDTSFALGFEQLLRGWAYGSNAKDDKPLVLWWWGAYVNYDVTPQFGLKLELDNDFYSSIGTDEIKTDITHLRLGVGWSPTPKILIAPHLYVPINTFSWSAAAFNLEAWAQVF